MWNEFKKFAMRGSVIDLAVGVVIGVAFQKIVTSLVTDVITPPLSLITGKIKFESLFFSLGKHYDSLATAQAANAPTINYGLFVQNIIDFVIVAFVIFLVIRQVNKLQERMRMGRDEAPVSEKDCPFCTMRIPVRATRCPQCTSELGE